MAAVRREPAAWLAVATCCCHCTLTTNQTSNQVCPARLHLVTCSTKAANPLSHASLLCPRAQLIVSPPHTLPPSCAFTWRLPQSLRPFISASQPASECFRMAHGHLWYALELAPRLRWCAGRCLRGVSRRPPPTHTHRQHPDATNSNAAAVDSGRTAAPACCAAAAVCTYKRCALHTTCLHAFSRAAFWKVCAGYVMRTPPRGVKRFGGGGRFPGIALARCQ